MHVWPYNENVLDWVEVKVKNETAKEYKNCRVICQARPKQNPPHTPAFYEECKQDKNFIPLEKITGMSFGLKQWINKKCKKNPLLQEEIQNNDELKKLLLENPKSLQTLSLEVCQEKYQSQLEELVPHITKNDDMARQQRNSQQGFRSNS